MSGVRSPLDRSPEVTTGDVFLSYQQELMASVAAFPVTVVEKSRRTGFSWALGAVATLTASAAKAAGGMDVLYMGYNLEMAREFISYVETWARQLAPAAFETGEFLWQDPDHPERSVLAFRVRFASGFEVVALPSVARALRGKQGLVILDEAAFIDELGEVLKAALALLMWGGRVVVVSTHNGETNPFNVLVNDVRAGRLPYHLMRLDFDSALGGGLYRRICAVAGQEWSAEAEAAWRAEIVSFYGDSAEEELFCVPNPASGAFLPGPLIEARMEAGIAVARWTAPPGFGLWPAHLREAEAREFIQREIEPALAAIPDEPVCFGFDIARRGDLSALPLLGIGADLVRRTRLLVEMRDIPFSEQRLVLWHVLGAVKRLRGGFMDATGLGMQIAEETAEKFGASVTAVMLTEPWYRENMPPFKAAFEDAMITVPRDREVEGDLRLLRLVRGVARVPPERTGAPGAQRHGDAAVALALAYAASRMEPDVYDYQARSTLARPGWKRDHPDEEDVRDATPRRGVVPPLRGRLLA